MVWREGKNVRIDFGSGMVRQCYDGATVMRGIHWGVQRLIREVALSFIFIATLIDLIW